MVAFFDSMINKYIMLCSFAISTENTDEYIKSNDSECALANQGLKPSAISFDLCMTR